MGSFSMECCEEPSCVWQNEADWSPCVRDSVHVWSTRLDRDDSSVNRLITLLSPEERERASRYRFVRDHNRFIVRRGMLRTILARYTQMSPHDVQFQTGEFGKIHLSDSYCSTLEFSVTQSQGDGTYRVG